MSKALALCTPATLLAVPASDVVLRLCHGGVADAAIGIVAAAFIAYGAIIATIARPDMFGCLLSLFGLKRVGPCVPMYMQYPRYDPAYTIQNCVGLNVVAFGGTRDRHNAHIIARPTGLRLSRFGERDILWLTSAAFNE